MALITTKPTIQTTTTSRRRRVLVTADESGAERRSARSIRPVGALELGAEAGGQVDVGHQRPHCRGRSRYGDARLGAGSVGITQLNFVHRDSVWLMRVSISAAVSSPEDAAFVVDAERLGAAIVWVPEVWAQDGLTPLAYLAAKTTPIGLATG